MNIFWINYFDVLIAISFPNLWGVKASSLANDLDDKPNFGLVDDFKGKDSMLKLSSRILNGVFDNINKLE